MVIVQPGFLASYVKLLVGNYCWMNPWAHTSQICQIYLFAYDQWGDEMSKNDIELIVPSGFGFIYEPNGGKL